MDTDGVIQLLMLFILVCLSAFFSSAETSLSTANRVRLKNLADEGNKRAQTALDVLDKYGKMLSAILIGNNIVNLTASSLMTTFALKIHLSVGIATGILTVVILIFGEILPKNTAMVYSEKMALFYASIIAGLMKIMTPAIFLVDKISGVLMSLLHIDTSKRTAMTETELRTYVEVSHEDGVIESEEREMIYNVFDFSDAVAKDVMIPRIDMATVSREAGYDEVLELFRDFILVDDREQFKISDIMREAYYTYEYKKTADLLIEMREKRINVSFVLNEYGAAVGMITLEDLLEEIVGEIRDEYDEDEEELIQQMGDRAYLVEGSMKLSDINDELGTMFSSEDYDSIGGLIIENLDRLPKDGETIETEQGVMLTVQGVNQNRIAKVLMALPEKKAEEDKENSPEKEDASQPEETGE